MMYNIAISPFRFFVNELGTDTVAAWGTMGKIDAVFWMVCNAFAISITTFVGQNYGAGKYPPHAKKCPRLYGDGIHFGVYCKRSTYSVRKSDLPFVYNRSDWL